MKTTMHAYASRCPFCLYTMEAATGITDDEAPEDGAATMCIACGEFAVFERAAPGGLRKPTDEEYGEFAAHPLMRKMRALWVEGTKQGLNRHQPGEKPKRVPFPAELEANMKTGSMFGNARLPELFEQFHLGLYGPDVPKDDRVKSELWRWYMLGAGTVVHEMNHMAKRGPTGATQRIRELRKDVEEFATILGSMLRSGER